ncbi:MAG: hypothetical protein ACRDTG_26275 [Pseudonocardiaceae bacterium]
MPSTLTVMVAVVGAALAGCGRGGPDSDTGAAPSSAAPGGQPAADDARPATGG